MFKIPSKPAGVKSGHRHSFRPELECLEERRLMSIDVVSGRLEIRGSDNWDTVHVNLSSDTSEIYVSRYEFDAQGNYLGSESKTVNRYLVWQGIHFYGKDGDDTYVNDISMDHPYLVSFAHGEGGNDTLRGSRSGLYGDKLYGGEGQDSLYGREGNDSLYGGAGGDWYDGGAGTDRLVEGDDRDWVLSNGSLLNYTNGTLADVHSLTSVEQAELFGGAGNNTLNAALFSGSVSLWGGAGNDILYGGSGSDYLYGQGGRDILYGGANSDVLDGGSDQSIDEMYGQGGWDIFYSYRTFSISGSRYDQVKDRETLPNGQKETIIYGTGQFIL